VIVEVLQLALLSEVMNTPTALTDGWKGAQVLDCLLCRRIGGANEHSDGEDDGGDEVKAYS